LTEKASVETNYLTYLPIFCFLIGKFIIIYLIAVFIISLVIFIVFWKSEKNLQISSIYKKAYFRTLNMDLNATLGIKIF
jgi:hypothetical protein